MRPKLARVLRKWADLIDPRVSPSEVLTIRVACDSKDAEEALARLTRDFKALNEMAADQQWNLSVMTE